MARPSFLSRRSRSLYAVFPMPFVRFGPANTESIGFRSPVRSYIATEANPLVATYTAA